MRWAVFVLVLVVAGCARTDGGSLHRGNGPDPATLDPHLRADEPSAHILADLYEGLLTPGPDGEPVPGVAERWDVSEDGLTWTFQLRTDARWCDGTPVTAGQFAAAFARVTDPATAAPFASLLAPIVRVETDGDHRLTLMLSHPQPLLEYALAQSVGAPLHPAAPHAAPIGNGPYCLTERRPQSHVRLERNPHHWDADAVAIESVYFHTVEDLDAELSRYRSGALHITTSVPAGREAWVAERFGSEFRHDAALASGYLVFNQALPPFAGDVELRRSLSAAVDRELFVRVAFGGFVTPARTLVPPIDGYTPPPPPDHAPQPRDEHFALRHPAGGPSPRIATVVAAMWREAVGVEVVPEPLEWKVYLAAVHGGEVPGAFRYAWGADVPDPLAFLTVFRSGNPFGFASPTFDTLLERAAAEADRAARMTLLAEAEALLLDDAAVVPLYHDTNRRLVSARVRGWRSSPLDRHPTRWLSLEPAR